MVISISLSFPLNSSEYCLKVKEKRGKGRCEKTLLCTLSKRLNKRIKVDFKLAQQGTFVLLVSQPSFYLTFIFFHLEVFLLDRFFMHSANLKTF